MSTTEPKRTEQERTVQALHTANQWSSDQAGHGLALLSLGTCRRIHSEEHRQQVHKEIADNIAWVRRQKAEGKSFPEWANSFDAEVELLNDLLRVVNEAEVGREWITDADNLRINDRMHLSGELK